MVPDPSRRRVIAAGGTLVGSFPAWQRVTNESVQVTNRDDDPTGWPMEQHDPGGTSYAPDASGPKNGVRIRWKQRIETDLGFAYRPTPVVANGLVYGVGRELVCVDAASGEVVFRADREYGGPPAVASARAYRSPTLAFATRAGADGLHARGGISLAGLRFGLTRWQAGREDNDLSVFDGGPPRTVPVGADGTVFVTTGTGLLAIDTSSGRVRWRGQGGVRRPAVHDSTVYVAAYSKGLLGYDVATGKQTLAIDARVLRPLSVTATPERLVVGTDEGLAGVGSDGTVTWRFAPENLFRDYGAIAVANGVAFAGFSGEQGNMLVAIDTADGTERWRVNVPPEASPQFAPPSVADGVVYLPTEDGGLAAVDAGDGHVRWRFELGDRGGPWSPAALVGETLYALGNGHLYALEEA